MACEDGQHHSSTRRARLSFRVPGHVPEATLAKAVQSIETLRNDDYDVSDTEWQCVTDGTEAFLFVHLVPRQMVPTRSVLGQT